MSKNYPKSPSSSSSLPDYLKKKFDSKIVYCLRNPKNSWHFGKKLAPEETADHPIEDAVETFCKGKFIGGQFWEHVLGYWHASKKNTEKVLFVAYEALKNQTGVELKRIVEFLGCCFTEEEERRRNVVEEIVRLCNLEANTKWNLHVWN